MSRYEAYEAAIDELTDLVDRIDTFYTDPMTDEAIAIRATAIVDAFLKCVELLGELIVGKEDTVLLSVWNGVGEPLEDV